MRWSTGTDLPGAASRRATAGTRAGGAPPAAVALALAAAHRRRLAHRDASLDGIAATEGQGSTWAISKQTKRLYRISNTSVPGSDWHRGVEELAGRAGCQ